MHLLSPFEAFLSRTDKEYRVLKHLCEEGKINSGVLGDYVMEQKQSVIDQYQYKIYYDEPRKGWSVYYKAEDGKRKRKTLRDKEKLEDFVADLVIKAQRLEIQTCLCLEDLYEEYIQMKSKMTRNQANILRIQSDWNRFYKDDKEFIRKPITEMNKAYVREWIYDNITKHDLTAKAYNNMIVIAREMFDLCTDEKYDIIPRNWLREIRIPKRMFAVKSKPKPETQVYSEDEIPKVIDQLHKNYIKRNDTLNLAVILLFYTGLRVSELSALKFSDIEGNILRVQRSVGKTAKLEGAIAKTTGYEVKDYLKCHHLEREVPLSDECLKLIKEVRKANLRNGERNNSFIFIRNGNFIEPRYFETRIKTACKNLGITYRSIHKIRKTYISMLRKHDIPLDTIRQVVGHSSEQVTLDSYDFDINSKESYKKILDIKVAN